MDKRQSPLESLQSEVFDQLPIEEQINRLVEGLKREEIWRQDREAVCIVNELELLFGGDEVGFRACLREIYSALPSEQYSLPWSPKLRSAILKRILRGWRYVDTDVWSADAEQCFLYVCGAWNPLDGVSWPPAGLQHDICDLFREHLNNCLNLWYHDPRVLDEWICREETPQEIAKILLFAQLHSQEGVARAIASIGFLRGLSQARSGAEEESRIMNEFHLGLADSYRDE